MFTLRGPSIRRWCTGGGWFRRRKRQQGQIGRSRHDKVTGDEGVAEFSVEYEYAKRQGQHGETGGDVS